MFRRRRSDDFFARPSTARRHENTATVWPVRGRLVRLKMGGHRGPKMRRLSSSASSSLSHRTAPQTGPSDPQPRLRQIRQVRVAACVRPYDRAHFVPTALYRRILIPHPPARPHWTHPCRRGMRKAQRQRAESTRATGQRARAEGTSKGIHGLRRAGERGPSHSCDLRPVSCLLPPPSHPSILRTRDSRVRPSYAVTSPSVSGLFLSASPSLSSHLLPIVARAYPPSRPPSNPSGPRYTR